MDENTNPTGAAGATSGDTAGESSTGRFERAREYAGEKFGAAAGAVRDGYGRVREQVDDVDFGAMANQVRTYVRSNPAKALMISIGVGFLVGMLLRRDEDED